MLVLDTDILVAAIRSRTGASAALIGAVLRGEYRIAMSIGMAIEYEAVATRMEHLAAGGMTERDVGIVIDALISVAMPVVPHFRWRPQLRDPNDEMVLEAAANAGGSAIVTFNRRDFIPAAATFGIDLLLPREALEMKR